ncbi:MAG: Asp-tRNA(Asn)/Glu-tRNA(Gln) amidotransferase subunit GatB [Gammaproteobacteria bacterium]
MPWESVIGLEIHVQLATKSKMFSGAPTAYGAAPNTQACAVDLGLPGVLPVPNREAVRMAVKFGLAVHAEISRRSVFARKNYFYPDLPRGYQISQYESPIVTKGYLDLEGDGHTTKRVRIIRAHLEEDAGKSLHEGFQDQSGIDLNRAGTPLLEVVSEPDLRSAKEAVAYMRKLHTLVRYLGICDGNMQEGSFRCDANVSVRPQGEQRLGTRTELKNLNSFRFVEKAIEYEIERQIDILETGGAVIQETRLFDSDKGETRPMRQKEEAHDYRYFPDPDLLPLVIDEGFIAEVGATLPELPDDKRRRFMSQFGLSAYEAELLTATHELADYYEAAVRAADGESKLTAHWVIGELAGALNKAGKDIAACPIRAEQLGRLIKRIADQTVSGKIAKQVFEAMWKGAGDADTIIEASGLRQLTDSGEIEGMVKQVLAENPEQLAQYRGGKTKVLAYFVGQVMKKSSGKADPQQVNTLLEKFLH